MAHLNDMECVTVRLSYHKNDGLNTNISRFALICHAALHIVTSRDAMTAHKRHCGITICTCHPEVHINDAENCGFDTIIGLLY